MPDELLYALKIHSKSPKVIFKTSKQNEEGLTKIYFTKAFMTFMTYMLNSNRLEQFSR